MSILRLKPDGYINTCVSSTQTVSVSKTTLRHIAQLYNRIQCNINTTKPKHITLQSNNSYTVVCMCMNYATDSCIHTETHTDTQLYLQWTWWQSKALSGRKIQLNNIIYKTDHKALAFNYRQISRTIRAERQSLLSHCQLSLIRFSPLVEKSPSIPSLWHLALETFIHTLIKRSLAMKSVYLRMRW